MHFSSHTKETKAGQVVLNIDTNMGQTITCAYWITLCWIVFCSTGKEIQIKIGQGPLVAWAQLRLQVPKIWNLPVVKKRTEHNQLK